MTQNEKVIYLILMMSKDRRFHKLRKLYKEQKFSSIFSRKWHKNYIN